jgi:hypothetical protein
MAVTYASFINKYETTQNEFDQAKLTAYITRYQEITLIELFGKELYDLYVTGIAGADADYTFLRDAFTVQLDSGTLLNSRGVDDLIMGVVYFYYHRDNYTQQSINGGVKNKGENSENVSVFVSNIQARWDEAISSYHAIQYYILENDSVYPTFLGLKKEILQLF